MYNTAFPTTPANIFGIFHTVRKYQDEYSTILYVDNNSGVATEETTIGKITPHRLSYYTASNY